MRSLGPIAEVFGHRSRIRYLEADLAALGVPESVIAATPECDAASALGSCAEIATGSLYVLEGSTLGGVVIGRALRQQSWVPPQGLQYFAPPQRDVHEDWRALHDWANTTWPQHAWQAIAAGARATFDTLDSWMSPAMSAAPREPT